VTKLLGIHWPNYPCKNDWWGRLLLPEILSQTDRIGAKSPIFDLFSLYSDSAVTPSEKSSINANRKSSARFPMSLR